MTTGTWKTSNKKKSGPAQKTKITQFFKPAAKSEVKKIVKRELTKTDHQLRSFYDPNLPMLNERLFYLNLLGNIQVGLLEDQRTDEVITLKNLYMKISVRSADEIRSQTQHMRFTIVKTNEAIEVGADTGLLTLLDESTPLATDTYRQPTIPRMSWINNNSNHRIVYDKYHKMSPTGAVNGNNETIYTIRHNFKMERFHYKPFGSQYGKKYNYYLIISASTRFYPRTAVVADAQMNGVLTFSNN